MSEEERNKKQKWRKDFESKWKNEIVKRLEFLETKSKYRKNLYRKYDNSIKAPFYTREIIFVITITRFDTTFI